MNGLKFVYTYNGMLFYLSKKEILLLVTWMNLEDIILNEINQT
jgi:hypothetical protein